MKLLFSSILVFLLFLARASPPDSIAIYHSVTKGETLTSIAKKYHVKEGELRRWNNLKSADLKLNQNIIVAYHKNSSPAIISDDIVRYDTLPKATSRKAKKPIDSTALVNKYIGKEIFENGLVSFSDRLENSTLKFYALHNDAPEGTIIKIENSLSRKTVYVKVIGIISSEYPGDNLIIISTKAAQKLDITDQDFECKISYTIE